jgi:hypothetical protein
MVPMTGCSTKVFAGSNGSDGKPAVNEASDCRLGLVRAQVAPFFRIHVLYGLARCTHGYLATDIQDLVMGWE